jgi:hypothetical protein
MIRLVVLGIAATAFCGCAGNPAVYDPPIVDMVGVDPVRCNNDLESFGGR